MDYMSLYTSTTMKNIIYQSLIGLATLTFVACDNEGTSEDTSTSGPCEGEGCNMACEEGFTERLGECVANVEDDEDFDGVPKANDNCPLDPNPDQRDCDQDGLGDACDNESICGITLSGYISLYDFDREEDRALGNALIEVEGHPLYTQTDESGQYRLTNLEPGDYHLLVFQPPEEMSGARPLTLARLPFNIPQNDDNASIERDFVIDPPGDIIGAVAFAEQSPFEAVHGGIGVYVEHIPFATTISDQRGRFELRGVPAGEHHIKFVYPEHEPMSVPTEVISLSSTAIGVNGELKLQVADTSEEWAHEVAVEVNDLAPSAMVAFELELSPAFPHISEPQSLRFEGMSDAEGHIALSLPISHRAHEVYNIEVSETIKRSNLYLLDRPEDARQRLSEVITDRLPETWIDFSERLILMSEELPLEIGEPQVLMSADYQGLPIEVESERGDLWTVESLRNSQGEALDASVRLAPLRYPLAHKFGELALAKTHSLLLNINPIPTEAELETQLTFTYRTASWDRDLKFMAAPHPCPPNSFSTDFRIGLGMANLVDCGFYGSGHDGDLRERCELQSHEINLSECVSDEPGVFTCQTPLTIPLNESEMRIWITGPTEAEESLTTQEACNFQCLNEFRQGLNQASTYLPIYPLIHRDLSQDANCSEVFQSIDNGFYEVNQTPLIAPTHCSPNLPPHNLDDQLGACLSQPSRSAAGRHLIVNGLVADSPQDVGFFGSQIVVDLAVDSNELNPMIVYNPGVVCLTESRCEWPVNIKYSVSDGMNQIIREEAFGIAHLSEGDQDYCWSFSE